MVGQAVDDSAKRKNRVMCISGIILIGMYEQINWFIYLRDKNKEEKYR